MTHATYADALQPTEKSQAIVYNIALILTGSWIIALAAQVKFMLIPPVPFTAQTFAVILAGMLLGSKRGFACVVAYLLQGIAGLPFFSGGAWGWSYFTGATFGYLGGFAVAAWLVGRLAELGWDRRPSTAVAAMSIGTLAVLTPGVAWLVVGLHMNLGAALYGGAVIFLPGEILKIAVAAVLLPLGWKYLGKQS